MIEQTHNHNETRPLRKFVYIIVTVLCILALIIFSFTTLKKTANTNGSKIVHSFEECETNAYELLESYPRQCRAPDGKTFIEEVGNEIEKLEEIQIIKPRPNQKIQSPLIIKGQARGSWYFEGVFPITLEDENGNLMSQVSAQSEGEWTTEHFVPFTAVLEFTLPQTRKGKLILRADNPSGLPEKNDELWLPVQF